jgi:hypothetical protein
MRPVQIKNWWQNCICKALKIKRRYNKNEDNYDYFEDVTDKYPEEIYRVVMPQQYQQKQLMKKSIDSPKA